MWVFNKDGFFSAVQHKDDPGSVVVRARVHEDLLLACDRMGVDGCERTLREADYAFRVTVPRALWVAYVRHTANDLLDYTNFKAAVHGEPDRDRALLRVWQAMHDLQEDRIEDKLDAVRRAFGGGDADEAGAAARRHDR